MYILNDGIMKFRWYKWRKNMSKHNNFYHKGKKVLFSSMAVAALSVIAVNPVAAKTAEAQKEQPVKSANTKPTVPPVNSGDNAGENDSHSLWASSWTKGIYSYDKKTKTFTIRLGKENKFNNHYAGDQEPPINPARIAWNIDDVNTDEIETINIDGPVIFEGDASLLFANLPNLKKIKGLNNLNTKEVTSMKEMFANDPKLTSIDLSNFNTSNVTDMMGMFFGDEALSTLNVSNFKTDSVEDMSYMFSDDSSLTKIDGLEKFNTEKVTKMWEMFKGDKALTSLDISNFKMAKHDENIQDNVSDTNNTDDNKGTANPSHQTYTIDQDMLSGMDSLSDITLGAGNIINNSGLRGSVEESLWDGKTTWFLKDSKDKGLSSVELMQKFDGKNDATKYAGEYTTTKPAPTTPNTPSTPSTPSAPSTPSTPSNTTNTGNTNTNTTTDKQDTNKTDTNKPETNKPATDNKKPAKKAKKGVKRVVTHNAYIFNQKGKRVKAEYFVGKTITTYGTKTINGKKFYALGKNRFVKANNVTGINRKLKHNAFIYTKKANNKVKRYGHDVLKKNKSVRTYGGAVKMHNKLYYIVGKNQFVKKANF